MLYIVVVKALSRKVRQAMEEHCMLMTLAMIIESRELLFQKIGILFVHKEHGEVLEACGETKIMKRHMVNLEV